MVKKFTLSFIVAIIFTTLSIKSSFAQNQIPPKTEYSTGVIKEVISETKTHNVNQTYYNQKVKTEILNGPDKGKLFESNYGENVPVKEEHKLRVNDKVVIQKVFDGVNFSYHIDEKYRINSLIIIFVIFACLAIIFAKLKGITSLLGLAISFIIIITFILPNLLAGNNPILVSAFGSFLIAVFSLYLAHGLNLRTTVSLVSTLLTLAITTGIAFLFVYIANLSGQGSEEAIFVSLGTTGNINIKGLLLAGIIIGTLGVLDDITTAQTAAVEEIHKANPLLSFIELYKRATNIGIEHIASLVNTLVLAYAGASLPLLLLFTINKDIPFWVTINSQALAEEIVRTLTSSIGLIFAVPISTLLAAYLFGVLKVKSKGYGHSHSHDHFHVH